MIDSLFGSKTRVKLLYLFLNNPGQSFFVREITRKIGEQINSVRRELLNMIQVGIVTSDSSDNKLYYQVNQRYDYYVPLRAIFSSVPMEDSKNIHELSDNSSIDRYVVTLKGIAGLRIAIFAGVLVQGSKASVDIILVGDLSTSKVKSLIKDIEKGEGREINYSVLAYDEFYYRLSVRDKFITEILNNQHTVIIDKDNVFSKNKGVIA